MFSPKYRIVHFDNLIELIIGILGVAFFMWAAKYFYFLWYFGKKREQVNKLEARVAVLRMLLKTKLKRKGALMQEQYKSDKAFLEKIFSKLELLTTYNFQRNSDYNEVVGILLSISELVDAQMLLKSPEVGKAASEKSADMLREFSHLAHAKKWIQLLKYDKGNIFIIKEVIETVIKLKTKIEDYNKERLDKENHLKSIELISLTGFEDLKIIVDSEYIKNANKSSDLHSEDDTQSNKVA